MVINANWSNEKFIDLIKILTKFAKMTSEKGHLPATLLNI